MAPLRDVGTTMAKVQASLELGDLENITEDDRNTLEAYNRDDCVSTWRLRDWLEDVRGEQISGGAVIDRPMLRPGDPAPDISAWQEKIGLLVNRLTDGTPIDPAARDEEQQAKWILAYILDWHRREMKAVWWEHFRLGGLSAPDLLEERAGLSGLAFVELSAGPPRRRFIATAFRRRKPRCAAAKISGCWAEKSSERWRRFRLQERTVDVKKRQDTAGIHPAAVYTHKVIGAEVMAEALARLGEYVADHGMTGDGPFRAARDLLMAVTPRIGGHPIRDAGETTLDAAVRIAPLLDGTVLPIQGPPGAGKTHTGARHDSNRLPGPARRRASPQTATR